MAAETDISDELGERVRLTKRQYSEPLRNEQAATKAWQVLAFVEAFAIALAVCGLIYLGTLPKSVLYVVEKDKAGNVVYGGTLAKPQDMTDATWSVIKAQQLMRFIEAWRTVTSDRDAQAEYWDRAFAFIGDQSKANSELGDWLSAHDPIKRSAAGESVQVVYRSYETEGSHTMVIWFDEITKTTSGTTRQGYKASFVYSMHLPSSEKARRENPLGVLITDFNVVEDNH